MVGSTKALRIQLAIQAQTILVVVLPRVRSQLRLLRSQVCTAQLRMCLGSAGSQLGLLQLLQAQSVQTLLLLLLLLLLMLLLLWLLLLLILLLFATFPPAASTHRQHCLCQWRRARIRGPRSMGI